MSSAQVISLDDFSALVGTRLPPGDWLTIDQTRIDQFADCTEDRQFIHVDPAAAAKTPFGGTVAHGFLTLSLITRLCESCMPLPEGLLMGVNYGCDRLRFINPVPAGSRVRALLDVLSVDRRRPGQLLLKFGITIEIENAPGPALHAEWLSLFYFQQ
jgi:acyl dehydratase